MLINIQADIPDEHVNVFCSFLKQMEKNGAIGHSENMIFDCDGDGTFRPRFIFDKEFENVKPIKQINHEAVHKIERGYWPEEWVWTNG